MPKILQLKITLKHSNPKIWRQFLIKDSSTFHDLHLVIQQVMGWTNSHLHQFIYQRNLTIGEPDLLERDAIENENKLKLSKIFTKLKMTVVYEYDFGDSWNHDLLLEKIIDDVPKDFLPVCLKGENNCPPEDCGGIHGFYSYLEILKDKNHEEYEEVREWMGEDYNPEEFDISFINENLKDYKAIEMY